MNRLGDVLELIHSSRRRFRTARATGRSDGSAWRLWWAGDDRFRFERDVQGGTSVGVRAGAVWWTVNIDGEAHTNDGDPNYRLGMEPAFGLLHTRSLLACAVLEILREEPVAGRPAVILRAMPRPEAEHWRWWGFWDSSDPIEVPIDLGRGIALGGLGFRVDEISFDEDFSPEVFSRPFAEDHRRVRTVTEIPREMSLEEAERAAEFPVLLPRSLPEGSRFLRCLVDRADPPEWVGLSWAVDPGHLYSFHLRQGPAVSREAAQSRGRELVRNGVRLLIEEILGTSHTIATVFFEIDGTWLAVDSQLPLDTVIELAVSVGKEP